MPHEFTLRYYYLGQVVDICGIPYSYWQKPGVLAWCGRPLWSGMSGPGNGYMVNPDPDNPELEHPDPSQWRTRVPGARLAREYGIGPWRRQLKESKDSPWTIVQTCNELLAGAGYDCLLQGTTPQEWDAFTLDGVFGLDGDWELDPFVCPVELSTAYPSHQLGLELLDEAAWWWLEEPLEPELEHLGMPVRTARVVRWSEATRGRWPA